MIRSSAASEPASEAAGGMTRVLIIPVMAEAGSGLGARPRTLLVPDIGMPEKEVVPEARVPETSVPDIIVSAVLAASPPGA